MKTNNKTLKYFQNIETLDDLKQEYRKLMMRYHPDRNPNNTEEATRISQEINAEYEYLFNLVKNIKRNKEGETYTSNQQTQEAPDEFINIINALMKYDSISIDLVGSWLWIGGDTKAIKEELKALGFKYAPNKCRWYKTFEPYKKKTSTIYTYDALKSMFGFTNFKEAENETNSNNLKLSYN